MGTNIVNRDQTDATEDVCSGSTLWKSFWNISADYKAGGFLWLVLVQYITRRQRGSRLYVG